MAEIVQQVLESSIQDLAILEKYNLFDSNEIKTILKKRREFEYRLRKVKKSREDFLRYISYEESLLKLIRIRREKSGLEIDRNEIEKTILEHIRNLFEFTINKFKSDISLWLSYVNFAKSQNQLDHVSMIYFRMLQIHNKDWLWLKFAKFEFEDKASSETARKVFLKAISFHSDSKQIWHEYFRFELLYCTKIKRRFNVLTNGVIKSELEELNDKQIQDAVWNGKLALIVYKHAINSFAEDFQFAAAFIDICNHFDSDITKEVKDSIFEDLKLRFGSCEEYLNLIALDKIHEYEQTMRSNTKMPVSEKLKLKQEALNKAIMIFETACLNFDNIKMWEFYLLFRLNDFKHTTDQQVLSQKVAEVIFTVERLWKDDKVTVCIFQEWIKLMYTCNKKDAANVQKIHKLLKEAAERWPTNLQVYMFIACIMIKLPDKKIAVTMIDRFFQDALYRKFALIDEQNMETLIDFWELYLDWSVQSKASYHKLMKISNQLNNVCIHAPRRMSTYFKSKILAIHYHLFGIEKARSYYETNKTVSPICKDFSYKMIEIEKHFAETLEEDSADLPLKISSIYEDLTHHFGSDDIHIWLAYLRHLMAVDPTKIGQVYEKALRNFDNASKCQQFIQQYSLLKAMSVQVAECALVNA